MKNYMDQFRMTVVAGTDDYAASATDLGTDVEIKKGKLYDTTSSADAFAAVTVGDVIKLAGWDQEENNGIFIVTDVEASGEWIAVDTPLVDVLEADVPTDGIDFYENPIPMTVAGVTKSGAKVLYALNMTNPAVAGPEYFKVTADNTVSCFADLNQDTATDGILVFWADLSEG